MPAKPISVSGRYLAGLLASGSRPYPYRHGVHRLLGIPPPARTAIRFLPPLPPVGFQYTRDRMFSGLAPSMPWSDQATPFSQDAGEAVSVEGTVKDGQGIRPKIPATPARTGSDDLTVEREARGVRTGEGDGRRAPQTPEQHLAGTRHTGLEIPGITQRRSLFAALSARKSPRQDGVSAPQPSTAAMKSDDQHPARLDEKAGSSAIPPPMQGTQAPAPPPEPAPAVARSAETDRTDSEIPDAAQGRSRFAAVSGQRAQQANAASLERLDIQQTATGETQSPTVDSGISDERGLPQRTPGLTAHGPSNSTEPAAVTLQPEPIATRPKQRLDSISGGFASRAAVKGEPSALFQARSPISEGVSQLEGVQSNLFRPGPRFAEEARQLTQAAAKRRVRQTTAPGEPRAEPAAAETPVPPPPVIVVQRIAGPIRQSPPRAFWSGSTLRSIHLRILR